MAGGGAAWYDSWAEYIFTEKMILVVMMLIGAIFEFTHHHIEHWVNKWGKHSFKVRLWHRMNAEFMVLGFLSFVVWTLARVGAITAAAESHSEDTLGPTDGSDLLHVIEDVHMRLFMAMCLYFIFILLVVRVSEKAMRCWWQVEMHVSRPAAPETTGLLDVFRASVMSRKEEDLYLQLRGEFLRKLQLEDPTRDYVNFNFTIYLILSLEEFLIELVNVKNPTWLATAALHLVLGLTSGLAPAGNGMEIVKLGIVQAVVCMWVFLLLAFVLYAGWQHKREGHYNSKLGKYRTEITILRLLQIGLFFMCYTTMSFFTSEFVREEIKADVGLAVFGLCLYFVPIFLINGALVPWIVPRLNVIMRVPPFVDANDMKLIHNVADGNFELELFAWLDKDARKMLLDHRVRQQKRAAKGKGKVAADETHAVDALKTLASELESFHDDDPATQLERLKRIVFENSHDHVPDEVIEASTSNNVEDVSSLAKAMNHVDRKTPEANG